MKKAFIIFLIGTSFNGYSQETDSVLREINALTVPSTHVFKIKKAVSHLAPPATFILYGILSQESHLLGGFDGDLRIELGEHYPAFRTRIDDKLQFMPAVSAYALGFLGVKGKNTFADKTALYFMSNAIMGLSVYAIKTQTRKLRPDGSDNLTFPSGHTASAFAAAEFMSQEYKDVSAWYGIAAYSMAMATGSLRMLNNKHWLSDVVMGAGVGILSTKLAYVTYPILKRNMGFGRKSEIMLMPSYQRGMFGFSMTAPINSRPEK